MQWIKAHLTLVICVAVSLVAITLMVLGFVMPTVKATMAQDANIVQELARIPPVNERVVKRYEKDRDDIAKRVDDFRKQSEAKGKYQPLHSEVFPAFNSANPGIRFLFKDHYAAAQKQMLKTLNALPPPTDADFKAESEIMAGQKKKDAQAQSLGRTATAPGPTPGLGGWKPPAMTASPLRGTTPEAQSRLGKTPEQLVEAFPDVRLSVRRARSIYCYTGLDSFGTWPNLASPSPTVEDFWYAQMGLWIQQGVVKALAGLNNQTVAQLKDRQEQPWVGNLPVKRIVRITINGYTPPSVGGTAPVKSGVAGPGEIGATASFTKQVGSDTQDVVQFALELVVDARKLPAVIDAICRAGAITLLLVNYSEEPPNLALSGCIYGSAPTIHATLIFEGCFQRADYEKWMPPTIKTAISSGQAKFDQFQQGARAMETGKPGYNKPSSHGGPRE